MTPSFEIRGYQALIADQDLIIANLRLEIDALDSEADLILDIISRHVSLEDFVTAIDDHTNQVKSDKNLLTHFAALRRHITENLYNDRDDTPRLQRLAGASGLEPDDGG